ncbi:diguanylate cyclase domain-containing protein [Actinoplanes sp. HUAS TT8]|uniref:diguanylate cyclase domain-containing protein n=1 Tax=Actinoplanes sp. HUAS TT8 TaxID=3447453 RepID=UPI003F51EF9D
MTARPGDTALPVGALALAVLLSGWYLLVPGMLHTQVIICWVVVGACATLMSYYGFRAAGRMARADPRRRFWKTLGIAAAVFASGEWAQIVTAVAHPLSVASLTGTGLARTIALVLGCLIVVGVVLTYPIPHRSARERLCYLYDLATVVTTAGACGLSWTVSSTVGTGDLVTVAAGPVVAMLTAFAVGRLYLSGGAPFRWHIGVVGPFAAAVEGLARALGPELVRDGHPGVIFALTVTSHVLLMLAVWSQFRSADAVPDRIRDRRFSLLPYVALTACFGLLIGTLLIEGLSLRAWVAVAGVTVSTGIVVARQLTAFVANAELLEERDALAARLHTMAFTDSLTGLSNRAHFMERLDETYRDDVAVLLIDLDDFKPVNDAYGHAAGDAVLAEIAGRLREAAGPDAVVARLGGDEFAVLLDRDDPAVVAGRIVRAAAEPCVLPGGEPVRVRASVGIARSADGDSPAALLHAADQAMYEAKCAGKGAYRLARAG